MLQRALFAASTFLAVAASSQAAVMLTQSAAVPLAGTENLVRYDLILTSDPGLTVNGVDTPSIRPNPSLPPGGSMGLHQVWTPITNSPTPTRQEQLAAGVLWSDTWRSYDSHWLFDASNSLSVGAAFNETNTGDGEVLPSAGFGAPDTGYGMMGTQSGLPGAKAFTFASGLQGNHVVLAQLVMKATDSVLVNLPGVLTNEGTSQAFTDVCIGACELIDFEVDDLFLAAPVCPPGGLIVGGPLPTTDVDHPDAGITWLLESFVGPAGPIEGATVDPDTGIFSWQSVVPARMGLYTATIRGTNDNTPIGTDTGILQFFVPCPEPASIMLLGLGMLGIIGFLRRR